MSVRLRTRRTAAVLLGAALLAAATTACGPTDSTVSTSPKSTAAAPAAGGGSSAPAADAPKNAVAKTGDTIALKGTEKSNSADVTLVKVVDGAKGADEYTEPAAGKRYVTAQFRIKATGSAAYSDAPHNSAKLIDAQGQNYEATIAETVAGPEFPVPLSVAPGESALGCITFEVPADAKLDKVQFALDSGFAQQSGQWKLA
jgi:hypothetical protein